MSNITTSAPALSVFNFESSYQVRVTVIGEEPWFCLKDVCLILDIKVASPERFQLDSKGITKNVTPTSGGRQQLIYVNEPNLYRVIFRSNKPDARRFQDWVFNEVLPSIRKTGCYEEPVVQSEQLNENDMANLRRLIGRLCDDFRLKKVWAYHIWKSLRKATGRPSPSRFLVSDIQTIVDEIRRMDAIISPYLHVCRLAERRVINLAIRDHENADKLINQIQAEFDALHSDTAKKIDDFSQFPMLGNRNDILDFASREPNPYDWHADLAEQCEVQP